MQKVFYSYVCAYHACTIFGTGSTTVAVSKATNSPPTSQTPTQTTSVTVTKETNSPPTPQRPSQSHVLLIIGLLAGSVFSFTLTISITVAVVVFRREKRKKSSAVKENAYDYVTSPQLPPSSDMINNDEYGCLETSIPGKLGVFTAPSLQSNVAYRVINNSHSNNDYELTDTLRSEQYYEELQ